MCHHGQKRYEHYELALYLLSLTEASPVRQHALQRTSLMLNQETPLTKMKRLYGNKEALIASLPESIRHAGENVTDFKKRMQSVSNGKLLRLSDLSKRVQEHYSDKTSLVKAVATMKMKLKDSDYIKKLETYSMGKLLSMLDKSSKK